MEVKESRWTINEKDLQRRPTIHVSPTEQLFDMF